MARYAACEGLLVGSVGSLGELRRTIEQVSLRWRLEAILHLDDYLGWTLVPRRQRQIRTPQRTLSGA